MNQTADLNRAFGISGVLAFEDGADGLALAHLHGAGGHASVCLQGGHVFDWQVSGTEAPVLWLSPQAQFKPGKSIRGGTPVCWPWFGPHADNPDFPAHGFARTSAWHVVKGGADEHGQAWLTLALEKNGAPGAMWPYPSELELTVSVGASLSISLVTRNIGDEAFTLGEALHTYFRISDIESISVHGLDGCQYWDTVGGVERKTQEGDIRFGAETDRVYIDTSATCVIEDPVLRRRIRVDKTGSLSTVVWNPWTAKAERMGDLGQPAGWREFVCVESANAWDNKLIVQPGEVRTLNVKYSVESM
ncbi:MAG TPA: D-hexose-6-phosphate mutarotase [Rhodocyclaceae bacterium]|nr:D-hexose-6-phosphate mutarotase [Rhodocyclaceae bacterium]